MKLLVLFFVSFVALTAICSAEGYRLSGKAGDYSVAMTFGQARPVEGENRIEIAIKNKAARPVTDAHVKVEYLMPSLPGRAPMMDYATTAKPLGTVYEATLNLNMKGEWKAVVTVERGKQKKTVSLPFEVK